MAKYHGCKLYVKSGHNLLFFQLPHFEKDAPEYFWDNILVTTQSSQYVWGVYRVYLKSGFTTEVCNVLFIFWIILWFIWETDNFI